MSNPLNERPLFDELTRLDVDPVLTTPDPEPAAPDAPPGADNSAPTPEAPGDGTGKPEPTKLPVLPVRNLVLFPGVIVPISVGRDGAAQLVNDTLVGDRTVAIATQRDSDNDHPDLAALFPTATVATIVKLLRLPDGTQSIVVQGTRRVSLDEAVQTEPYLVATISPLVDVTEADEEVEALVRSLKDLASRVVRLSPNIPDDAAFAIQQIDTADFLVNFIAANLNIGLEEKIELLEISSLKARLKRVSELVSRELRVAELSSEINQQVRGEMEKTQREYFLREQLKAIQKELGEGDEGRGQEVEDLREQLMQKDFPDPVRPVVERELKRLGRMNPAAPDYGMTRTYLETLGELPWSKATEDRLDLKRAEEVLDEDHYGLEKIKRRILEQLAVMKLKADMRGPILLFVGPPGVGKTSLGQSIARALGREFVRFSLGGLRDEAEIRGHRRTYIGAMPGRIIQSIRKAGTINPVLMLDEIDKIGMDYRGDPASALLEVLDPAQNNTFTDHYLEVPYDLSKVMFIATANQLETIPGPLRDRMEIISLSGYTVEEKLHIAERYLLPRQIVEHGLKPEQIIVPAETLEQIVGAYTREAGVRNLEQQIAGVVRHVARDVALGKTEPTTVAPDDLKEILGPERHSSDVAERTEVPGVATGLAWTPVGGDILFIEATVIKGSGRMILTGKLGEVMKESAQAAFSYLKSRTDELEIPEVAFRSWDVHVHVPAGAIPKDGPSAGVTMLTALASIYTQRCVKSNLAMTGEITLRGRVLPVGGIKEKVLAAKAAGVEMLILPEKNRADYEEIDAEAVAGLEAHFVSKMDDVLALALEDERGECTIQFDDEYRTAKEEGKLGETPPMPSRTVEDAGDVTVIPSAPAEPAPTDLPPLPPVGR